MKKVNIFSLNFDVADFGNHVHNFVAMLLNNNNTGQSYNGTKIAF